MEVTIETGFDAVKNEEQHTTVFLDQSDIFEIVTDFFGRLNYEDRRAWIAKQIKYRGTKL